MMARVKNYILMIKEDKFFGGLQCFLKEKENIFSLFPLSFKRHEWKFGRTKNDMGTKAER